MAQDTHSICNVPVRELKERLAALRPGRGETLLKALEADPRKAARELAAHFRRQRLRDLQEDERLRNLRHFETELYGRGYERIAGVDEAGVAPLAGPVVAAAVILPREYSLPGLDDSKKILSERKREALAERILEDAVCWATGFAAVEEIDRLNIYRAGLLAMQRAVEGLAVKPGYVLVDARSIPHCPFPQRAIIHGDALSASIAAASLIAKTVRDARMREMDRRYPGYGFAEHKGYPTPRHLEALERLGAAPVHRRSFAPVRKVLNLDPSQRGLFPSPDGP